MRTKKVLGKILKIFLWVAVSIVGLLLLLSVLVYLPPVQNFVKDKAAGIVSQSLGMDLSIGRIRLNFPLSLVVDDTALATAEGDTLVRAGRVEVGVAVAPLFAGEIVVKNLVLENAAVNYRDTLSNMRLGGTLGNFSLGRTTARLNKQSADISSAKLEHADISLWLGESREIADTTASDIASIAWKLGLRRLDLSDVKFAMHTSPEVTELTANLNKGQLRSLSLDLGTQEITARLLELNNGNYAFLTDTATVIPQTTAELPGALSDESLPWTVRLARLEINDNAFRYGALYGEPASGFAPSHMELSGISLRIDSVFNRGTEVSAVIRSLAARERSGLEITGGQGRFAMGPAGIVLRGFDLRTPDSHLQAEAAAGATLLDMDAAAPLTALLTATVGMPDVFLFYPAEPGLRKALTGKPLSLDADISGTLGNISVRNLRARLANHIDLNAKGNVRSVTNPDNLAGNLNLAGKFADLDFVKELLPDTAWRSRAGFPAAMTLDGSVAATGSSYTTDLVLTADSGRLVLKGNVDTRSEDYRADLALENFPLGTFLPHDSLGMVALTLTAGGNGFDPRADNAAAQIEMNVGRFDYNGYNFSDIVLAAALEEHLLKGSLTADNEALNLALKLGGELRENFYAASLFGKVSNADIAAMGFSGVPLGITLDIDASASANLADTVYKANVLLDSVMIAHALSTEHVGKTTIRASVNRGSVTAEVLTGDLRLNFVSPESITTLANNFSAVANEALRQLDSLNIDMNPIQESMPAFRLDFYAGRNNPLRKYLRSTGIDFNELSVSAGNDGIKPFGAGIVVNGLRSGGLTLDTLNVWILRRDERLAYALRLRNRPGNIEQMAFIGAGGDVSGNTARISFIQRDRADSVGFRFGVTAQLLDSAVRASLTPRNPVFGYRNWSVNSDNFLTYHFDKRIESDLRLEGASDGQFFRITSTDYENMPSGSVRLDIGGIELGEVFSLFPNPIPIEGNLGGNGTVGLSGPIVKGDLNLAINGLTYDNEKVGDITARAIANTDENNLWNLDLYLGANEQTALKAWGTYDIANTGALDIKVAIPGLPLELGNAFLPADMLRMSGKANGELNVGGTLDKPAMNGGLSFEGAKLIVPMIGTTFGVSQDRIAISNNRIIFRDFGLISPNSQKLSLDGSLDITGFSDIRANLRLFAANFEAVNSTYGGGSQVYGRAVVDVDMNARGLLDALMVRGNVNILSRTDVFYTMRDSPLEIEDAKQDIVTFVSFAEEESWAAADSIPLRRQSSIDVLVNVDIQDNVQATLNLSRNGNNRIELVGDGALSFTMNNQGDTRLTGRYTLTGGAVVYNPPVISLKRFGIDDGSYVEWTGELANPSFNITANEATPIKVERDSGSEVVNFNVIVNVSNTLENMALAFDLSAPNNGDIQNYLVGLAPEQRASQAMYMLVTNQYLGDGSISLSGGDLDVTREIGSFVSKELNQWARNNLSGVDISVGIDSVEDEGGVGTHTDYSYSVSKSLFNDRMKVTVGGNVSDESNADVTENLVGDISLEYRLTQRDNMFLKAYRYNTRESILEGEVTETGVGFILRKKMNKLKELFQLIPSPEKRRQRREIRDFRRDLREGERMELDSMRRVRQDSLPPRVSPGLFRPRLSRDNLRGRDTLPVGGDSSGGGVSPTGNRLPADSTRSRGASIPQEENDNNSRSGQGNNTTTARDRQAAALAGRNEE